MTIPSQDDNQWETASFSSGTTASVTYSTSSTNRVVLAIIASSSAGTPPTPTSLSGDGLTWTKLYTKTLAGVIIGAGPSVGEIALDVWWAPAAAKLTTATVSAAMSGTMVRTVMVVIPYDNVASISLPFDPNVALPAELAIVSGSAQSISYSTSNTNDLLVWISAWGPGTGGTSGRPTGFANTNAVGASLSGGGVNPNIAINYGDKSQATVVTGLSATDNATGGIIYFGIALTGTLSLPGVPIDEACGTATTASITPEWAQGSGAAPTSYTLQWRLSGSVTWTTISGIVGTSQKISGLSPGSSYEWQVEAVNLAGNSGFSSSFFCSTLPAQLSSADLFFAPTASFVDLSVLANRRKFITPSGGAVYLGSDGSSPLGVQPPVFLTVTAGGQANSANTFAGNNGSGGAFAITSGPLTLSTSSPPGSLGSPGANGPNVVGDYRNGNLYTFNLDEPYDNGVPRRWLRTWRATQDKTRVPRRFDQLRIVMQTGAQDGIGEG